MKPIAASPCRIAPRESSRKSVRSSRKRAQAPASERSEPISLPKWHIRRTHSEQQLASDTAWAEHKDKVMYSRLMTGMRDQMKGNVDAHPLSLRSMEGIRLTRRAKDHELDERTKDHGLDDSGWALSYSSRDEDEDSAAHSSEAASHSRQSSTESMPSLLDGVERRDLEDYCVFIMDM